jgi:hypothetical protein
MLIRWREPAPDEPVEMYVEIGSDDLARRSVELYPNDVWRSADVDGASPGTMLPEGRMPSVAEYAGDTEFAAEEMASAEFEKAWCRCGPRTPYARPILRACPVCGFHGLEDEPWSGGCPSDEICECCGVHFGFDDRVRSHRELRERWVAEGMRWFSGPVPPDWDPRAQLRRIRD